MTGQPEITFPILPPDATPDTQRWYYELCQVLRRYLPPDAVETAGSDANETAQNAKIAALDSEMSGVQSDVSACDISRIVNFNTVEAQIAALQSGSGDLSLKEDKIKKGVANGYAPLNPGALVPLSYLDVGSKEDVANKGVANGYCPLDGAALVPLVNLPRELGLLGEVRALAHTTIPTGWLECNGQSVLRASYPLLFTLLNSGAWYGTADGTHFYVPDFRGRVMTGIGTGPANYLGAGNPTLATRSIATPYGEDDHTLTLAEIPELGQDTWNYNDFDALTSGGYMPLCEGPLAVPDGLVIETFNFNPAGGGDPHENRQPELPVTFVIRAI